MFVGYNSLRHHTYLETVDDDHGGHWLCSGAGPYTGDQAERDVAPTRRATGKSLRFLPPPQRPTTTYIRGQASSLQPPCSTSTKPSLNSFYITPCSDNSQYAVEYQSSALGQAHNHQQSQGIFGPRPLFSL